MKQKKSYQDSIHTAGRIWMLTALVLLVLVPTFICIHYKAWPGFGPVFKGLLGVAPIFWTVGTIEVFTYAPMLGAGGSYLGFVTGNLTNLKVPCALNAMALCQAWSPAPKRAKCCPPLAIAVSSLVTTVIIILGVCMLLAQLRPVLESPVLAPAFANILPALFGGLAVVYVSKDWKIALAPAAIFMVVLFLCVPSLSGSVGVLVPVGALLAIGVARILYKKGKL